MMPKVHRHTGLTTMLRRAALLLVFAMARLAWSVDTTPPLLSIFYTQPYLFHILVTVQLNEDGTVYCGALLNSGAGTHVPSVYELETGTNLHGHGSSAVTANVYTQIVVAGLVPGTMYDLYCYATDRMLNGIDIASTKRSQIVTASGGDYTSPTFRYIAPFEVIDSREVRVYFELSEDGTVWCVAKRDLGQGTTVPTSSEIRSNSGVDAWGTAEVRSATQYRSEIWLQRLTEDTVYHIYCFAVDMRGNGIDDTPARPQNASSIPATKRVVRTLAILVPTRFDMTTPAGTVSFVAEPAAWNVELPRASRYGGKESMDTPLALEAAQLVNVAAWQGVAPGGAQDFGTGCYGLPAAPRSGGPHLALLQRGRCAFNAKASRAHLAGYQGIVVSDYNSTGLAAATLPGMAAAGAAAASAVAIPGWLVSFQAGKDLADALSDVGPGRVRLDIEDRYRKPTLGNRQRDHFGVRSYAAM